MKTLEYGNMTSGGEHADSHETLRNPMARWSILDGYFDSEVPFPDPERIKVIESSLKIHTDEARQERIYYSSLLLYALETCDPRIFDDRNTTKLIGQDVSEATEKCLELRRLYGQDGPKKITEETLHPTEVPVMRALKEMQEYKVIDYEERTMLDAVVRTIQIKQR